MVASILPYISEVRGLLVDLLSLIHNLSRSMDVL
jgi:hypothetical protein